MRYVGLSRASMESVNQFVYMKPAVGQPQWERNSVVWYGYISPICQLVLAIDYPTRLERTLRIQAQWGDNWQRTRRGQ